MLTTSVGMAFLTQTTAYESELSGLFVTESAAVGIVFVIHPFV